MSKKDDNPPSHLEYCVVTVPSYFKRSALLFDRVEGSQGYVFTSDPSLSIPNEISFFVKQFYREASNDSERGQIYAWLLLD